MKTRVWKKIILKYKNINNTTIQTYMHYNHKHKHTQTWEREREREREKVKMFKFLSSIIYFNLNLKLDFLSSIVVCLTNICLK